MHPASQRTSPARLGRSIVRLAIGLATLGVMVAGCSDGESDADSSSGSSATGSSASGSSAPPGSSTPGSTAVAAQAAAEATDEIESVGHGDDDVDGHDLAVGANTPTDPQGRLYLHNGDRGPDVEAMQGRLIELGAPLDGVDGIYGDQTMHAVLVFQQAEGLTADGVVGTTTWATLDTPAAEVDWTLPDLPDEYATDVPEPTAEPTEPPAVAAPAGDGAQVGSQEPPDHDPATGTGAWAKGVIELSSETVTFYDDAGAVVLQAPVSSGKDGLTPVGTFHVQSKSERAYAGGDGGVYMDHMTRFNGGIGFHSIPKRADGSDIPTPLGQQAVSHGCVRMADDQAATVFANLPIGAVVEVHP